jgi:hypothetical protein
VSHKNGQPLTIYSLRACRYSCKNPLVWLNCAILTFSDKNLYLKSARCTKRRSEPVYKLHRAIRSYNRYKWCRQTAVVGKSWIGHRSKLNIESWCLFAGFLKNVFSKRMRLAAKWPLNCVELRLKWREILRQSCPSVINGLHSSIDLHWKSRSVNHKHSKSDNT